MKKKSKVDVTSTSVYETIGSKNHEEMTTKANLVIEISKTMKEKRLTQTRAAEILGITQPKLSELLRGHFRGYSVERLFHFLTKLGNNIDIVISRKTGSQKARIKVYHSNSETSPTIPIAAQGKS